MNLNLLKVVQGNLDFIQRQLEANTDIEIDALRVISNRILKKKEVILFAGGGKLREVHYGSIAYIKDNFTEREAKKTQKYLMESAEDKLPSFKLSKYLSSTSIFLNGHKVSREEVIKYTANKLGGTHFDEKRDEKKEKNFSVLDVAFSFHPLKGKEKFPLYLQEKYNGLHIELISIGQLVISAPQVRMLIKKIVEIEKNMS